MMIDTVPKFYSAHYLKVKFMDLEIFNVKVFFKNSYFPNYLMDFVHIWYDDRYSSKVLFSNTATHAHGLKVKVIDLKLLY